MGITVECTGCGKRFVVADSYAGRRGRCSRCGAMVDVPAAGQGAGGDKGAGKGDRAGARTASLSFLSEIARAIDRGDYHGAYGKLKPYLASHAQDQAARSIWERLKTCAEVADKLDEVEELIAGGDWAQARSAAAQIIVPPSEVKLAARLGLLRAKLEAAREPVAEVLAEPAPEAEPEQEDEPEPEMMGQAGEKEPVLEPDPVTEPGTEIADEREPEQSREPVPEPEPVQVSSESVAMEPEPRPMEKPRQIQADQIIPVPARAGEGWFVYIPQFDEPQGPFTTREIRTGLRHGSFDAALPAWRAGMAEWRAIGDIAELQAGPAAEASPDESLFLPEPPKKGRRIFLVLVLMAMLALAGAGVWLGRARFALQQPADPAERRVRSLMEAMAKGELDRAIKMADDRGKRSVERAVRRFANKVDKFGPIDYFKEYRRTSKSGNETVGKIYRVRVTGKDGNEPGPPFLYVTIADDTERVLNIEESL